VRPGFPNGGEAMVNEGFGDQYADDRRRTACLIPGIC
jgi:hypothetical protein